MLKTTENVKVYKNTHPQRITKKKLVYSDYKHLSGKYYSRQVRH